MIMGTRFMNLTNAKGKFDSWIIFNPVIDYVFFILYMIFVAQCGKSHVNYIPL